MRGGTRIAVLGSVLLGSAAILAGCADAGDKLSRTFGLTRDAPDEFVVTTRAPLSMPPNFNLRPPEPGAPRPQEQSDRRQAEAALVPQVELGGAGGSMTAGQQALVAAAGPTPPANIRSRVDQEAVLDRPSQSLTDRLMFWKPAPPAGTVVDPALERARLRQNAALGQSDRVGDTPIIQPKQGTGLFGSLF